MIVSLIPARGGSKRIPHKNIKMLAGKPMIAWTIEASLKSKYIDRTYVSTEDSEIKKIALFYGAEVIDRPVELASDKGHELAGVVRHFKQALTYKPDYLVFLHPTSPLRMYQHINEAYELLTTKNEPLIVSYTKLPHDISHYKFCKGKKVINVKNYKNYGNRQDNERYREKVYFSNGAIYISKFNEFNYNEVNREKVLMYVMDVESGIDVDTELDFRVAEILLKKRLVNAFKNI